MDIVDKKTRSRIMSGIRGQDTKPELLIRKSLHGLGLRFRTHVRELPGKPDLVFPKYRAVILVHGCFWHRHANCPLSTTPSSNAEFWQRKFQGTIDRDARNLKDLLESDWRVGTVWQCALGKKDLRQTSALLEKWLKSDVAHIEIELKAAPSTR